MTEENINRDVINVNVNEINITSAQVNFSCPSLSIPNPVSVERIITTTGPDILNNLITNKITTTTGPDILNNVTATKLVTTTGPDLLNDLTVQGPISTDSTITATGNISGAQLIGTSQQINGNSVVTGSQSVTGVRSGGDITSSTSITCTGQITSINNALVGQDLIITGDASIGQQLTVNGTIVGGAAATLGAIQCTTINATTSILTDQLSADEYVTFPYGTLTATPLQIRRSQVSIKGTIAPTVAVVSGTPFFYRFQRFGEFVHYSVRMVGNVALSIIANSANMQLAIALPSSYRPLGFASTETFLPCIIDINSVATVCTLRILTTGNITLMPPSAFAIGQTFFLRECSGMYTTNDF